MQSCHVCLPSTSIYSGPFPKSTSWWDSWRGCGHHTLMAGSNMWLGPSKKFLGLLYRDSRALHRALWPKEIQHMYIYIYILYIYIYCIYILYIYIYILYIYIYILYIYIYMYRHIHIDMSCIYIYTAYTRILYELYIYIGIWRVARLAADMTGWGYSPAGHGKTWEAHATFTWSGVFLHYTIWLFNIDPDNNQCLMDLI